MPSQNNPQDPDVLRDSLTREVTNDAYAIAGQIFKGPHSDVSRVSNEQLDERYRQAFMREDRGYLMAEASRDPAQFLAAMERLGVSMPPGEELQPNPPLPKAAKSAAPIPKAPTATQPTTYAAPEDVPALPTPPAAPAAVPPMVLSPSQAPVPLQAPVVTAMPPPPGVIPPPAQPPY
jgi:hypothetical protein